MDFYGQFCPLCPALVHVTRKKNLERCAEGPEFPCQKTENILLLASRDLVSCRVPWLVGVAWHGTTTSLKLFNVLPEEAQLDT